jgi:hypothetical protein
MKSRLHLYSHNEPQSTAYIIGEKSALRELGEKLIQASQSIVGFENIKFHTSDGHEYDLTIIGSVDELEWQAMSPPYIKSLVPKIKIIQDYNELKSQI